MLRKRKAPDKSFMHTDDCRVIAADPTVAIPWNEVGATGGWSAAAAHAAGRFRTTPSESGDGSLTAAGWTARARGHGRSAMPEQAFRRRPGHSFAGHPIQSLAPHI